MKDPRRPPKRGFLAYAERDRERRLAGAVSDMVAVDAVEPDAGEPASAAPAVLAATEPQLAADQNK